MSDQHHRLSPCQDPASDV